MSRVRTGNPGSAHRHTLNPRTNNQATVIHHFSKPKNDDATSSCEERPSWEWAWRANHRNCSKMSHRSDDFNIVLWSVCTPMPPRAKASAVLEQTEEPQPGMLLKIWCKFTTPFGPKKKTSRVDRVVLICMFPAYRRSLQDKTSNNTTINIYLLWISIVAQRLKCERQFTKLVLIIRYRKGRWMWPQIK